MSGLICHKEHRSFRATCPTRQSEILRVCPHAIIWGQSNPTLVELHSKIEPNYAHITQTSLTVGNTSIQFEISLELTIYQYSISAFYSSKIGPPTKIRCPVYGGQWFSYSRSPPHFVELTSQLATKFLMLTPSCKWYPMLQHLFEPILSPSDLSPSRYFVLSLVDYHFSSQIWSCQRQIKGSTSEHSSRSYLGSLDRFCIRMQYFLM